METTEKQIVKIDGKEFGLEETKAREISNQFKPMLDKMVELEKEYNEIIELPIADPESARKAKSLRLKYVKVRTGTAEIHKAQKAFYLAGGRFVDGWKNAQLFASEGIEKKLEAIEKFQENLEKERIAELQTLREEQLLPYGVENVSSLNLGIMSEQVWFNFFTGTRDNYQRQVEAEQKVVEQKIAEEKRIQTEQEAQRIENEKLKAEALAKEKELAEEKAKAEAERKAMEERANKERAEAEAKLKAEREANEKLQAEIKAKAEQEEKEKREAQEKVQAELKAKELAEKRARSAPDKAKLNDFAKMLDELAFPELKSEEAQKILSDAKVLLKKTSTFIKEKSQSI